MRIYLAGPMRGIKYFNYPLFHAYTKALRDLGHVVFSPAEATIKRYGDVSLDNPLGDESLAIKKHGLNPRVVFAEDLEYICMHAQAVAVIAGWEKSRGAAAEKAVGEALGLQIIYLGSLNSEKGPLLAW